MQWFDDFTMVVDGMARLPANRGNVGAKKMVVQGGLGFGIFFVVLFLSLMRDLTLT